jgi:histone-lysine N-methyltransferase SETMAR
VGCYIC